MSTPSKKEQRIIVKSLRKQGCEVRKINDGWFILLPDGGATSLHTSGSDQRSLLNMRARIRRAGLEWPL